MRKFINYIKHFLGKQLEKANITLRIMMLDPNRFTNMLNLNKKKGRFICRNGFVLKFDKINKDYIKALFYFSVFDGVLFSDKKKSYWNYKNNIITTPQGIKFDVRSFDELIFSETFLHDIHFSDFNLNNKIVVQAGGFTGDTALYYAHRGAKVYSFEPDPNSYNLAILNLSLNNAKLRRRVVFQNLAIGKDEIVRFPINTDVNSGGISIYKTGKNKTVKIRSASIKTILDEFKIKRPYLLDLDIKGSEFDIINEKVISKFEIVRIEYSTKIGDKKLGTRDYIIKRLKQLGFKNIRIYKHNYGSYDLFEHGTIEAKKQRSSYLFFK